jgi:hypothetical protein
MRLVDASPAMRIVGILAAMTCTRAAATWSVGIELIGVEIA